MCSRSLAIIVLSIVFTNASNAQRITTPAPYSSYYYDYKLANPAFTGSEGRHVITTAYSGNNAPNVNFFFASYEVNIESWKTSFGAIAASDEFGATKTDYFGLLFNKQISFTENSGIYLGMQLFYHRRKVEYDQLYGPNDPLVEEGWESASNASGDFGIVYYWRTLSVGISARDLLRPDNSGTSYSLILSNDFKIGQQVKLTPSVHYFSYSRYNQLNFNSTFEIRRWLLLGGGFRLDSNDHTDATFNAGVNIKGWVQIVTQFLSTSNYQRREYLSPQVEALVRVRIPGTDKDG